MTDDRKESFNPPVDTGDSPGSADAYNEPRGLGLDTTLGASRTGGMGGMAGTMTPGVGDDKHAGEPEAP